MQGCRATTQYEDQRVRVTRYDFDPGGQTGWHVHQMEYVIVTLTDCPLRLELPGGETRESMIAAGESYSRPKGTEHNVINSGDAAMAFVEVELK
ncbi:cupin domain-containing protein [Paracoccus tegillarcae]|uniref:Cupin n=1 Tax=Paracoccus tegillarcae TaxID=1529068 RepID=A0A2K9EIJ1_9RHOB|nr:cupin domain-containing protein [Paracoccus tegillarcae]AUH34803.1 cupin [Paracoccus tegillarcae]